MGKLKRGRTKYHTPSVNKSTSAEEESPISANTGPTITVPDNLFSGTDILQAFLDGDKKYNELNQIRENEDARSTISKKSFKSEASSFSKKDKRLLRREAFLMKLNAVKSVEMEEKKRKKRQKTVIIGDMKPMMDSLPSLPTLQPKVEKIRPTKFRSVPKLKTESLIHNQRVAKYKHAFVNFCSAKK